MADHALQLPDEDHGQEHLTEATYIKIAVILAIITTLEVVIYYIDWFHTSGALVPFLAIMSLVKFITVVSYFMHLKVDDKRYRYIFVCRIGARRLHRVGAGCAPENPSDRIRASLDFRSRSLGARRASGMSRHAARRNRHERFLHFTAAFRGSADWLAA